MGIYFRIDMWVYPSNFKEDNVCTMVMFGV